MTNASNLELQLTDLLKDLTETQDELLKVLTQKQAFMAANDLEGMESIQQREEDLGIQLQDCHDRRVRLLTAASEAGLPNTDLGSLSKAVNSGQSGELEDAVKQASGKMRILRHHGLTNWVVAQRTLLHLSQMLEIIARGGRLKATYGNENHSGPGGALIDQEA